MKKLLPLLIIPFLSFGQCDPLDEIIGEFFWPDLSMYGCTDEDACNFDPDALCNDGLCLFPGDELVCGWNMPVPVVPQMVSGTCLICVYDNDCSVIMPSGLDVFDEPWCSCQFSFEESPYYPYTPNPCNPDICGIVVTCDSIPLSISEIFDYSRLVTTVDILGKEATNKGFQLHIYDDGSVEKKYLVK